MALTPTQYAGLRTELDNDPRGYGYAGPIAAGNLGLVADALNLVRTGANGGPAIVVRRLDIRPSDVFEAIDDGHWGALGSNADERASHQRYIQTLVGISTNRVELLNPNGTATRVLAALRNLFAGPAMAGTRTRINALADRQGSRAEELFGTGVVLTSDDIYQALNPG